MAIGVSDAESYADTGLGLLADVEVEALIRGSIGLVHSIASGFCKDGRMDYEEAVADGMVGLVRAAQKFDPGRELAFSSYAYHLILGEMREGVRRFHKIRRKTRSGEGEARSQVVSLLNDTWARSIYPDGDNSESNADVLELPDPELLPLEQVCKEEDKRRLILGISTCLDARQRFLIEQHYFHGVMLIRIAAALGIGKDRVWQIHKQALGKLRMHQVV